MNQFIEIMALGCFQLRESQFAIKTNIYGFRITRH